MAHTRISSETACQRHVTAGAKCLLAGAGQDDRPHGIVGSCRTERPDQFLDVSPRIAL